MTRAVGIAFAVAAMAMAASPASALTISSSDGVVTAVDETGARNSLTIETDDRYIHLDVEERRGLIAGPGCSVETEEGFQFGVCPREGVTRVDIRLGRRGDDLLVRRSQNPPIDYRGGSGSDTVSYSTDDPSRGARVSLDDVPGDGFDAAPDNVHSDVENARGTDANELILGSAAANWLVGAAGTDEFGAGAGDDFVDSRDPVDCHQAADCLGHERDGVHCGPGFDTVDGDERDAVDDDCELIARNDLIRGTAGPDRITGFRDGLTIRTGAGDDRVHSGPGGNRIVPGRGRDVVTGGRASDRIDVRDGERDVVRCGTGRYDRVRADRIDRVARSCERIGRSRSRSRSRSR